jgi:hypothetical protein
MGFFRSSMHRSATVSRRIGARTASLVASGALLLTSVHAGAQEGPSVEPDCDIDPLLDSDGDGIPDIIEIRTGTNPWLADTDSDGVPDGVEDANRDGIVDPGESDPRVPGLFPGRAPHIPEPLVFDLVRGLGAERGEVEVNNLAVVNLRTGRVEWAPEVEWAFAHGHAVEFELPMVDRELEAVKFALQGTLPGGGDSFIHGWQTIGEVLLSERETEVYLLYLAGQRFAPRMSWLAMAGPRLGIAHSDGHVHTDLVLNASIFGDVREWQTIGFETNLLGSPSEGWTVRMFPQIHLQLSEHVRLQLSAGADWVDGELQPVGAARVILE